MANNVVLSSKQWENRVCYPASAEVLPRMLAVLALKEQQPEFLLWGSSSLNDREQTRVQVSSNLAGGA